MSKRNFSILINKHGSFVNIFANGLWLGTIKDKIFIPNSLFEKRNPFKTPEKFNDYLREIAWQIGTAFPECQQDKKES